MRIIKFNESLSKQEIDDLLLDLKDVGYEIDSDVFQGFIRIKGKIFELGSYDNLAQPGKCQHFLFKITPPYWTTASRVFGYLLCIHFSNNLSLLKETILAAANRDE